MRKSKRWLVITTIILIFVISSCGNNAEALESELETNETIIAIPEISELEPTVESEPETSDEDDLTLGQENALKSAKSYLRHTAYSYSALIKQLEFEGFTSDEALYAVDNCGADWNEQAAKSAESYLRHSSFSRSELIRQLEFEGFTTEQAEYGVSQVGY